MKINHSVDFVTRPVSIYFDLLTPEESPDEFEDSEQKPLIVMLHGGAHTGTCYLRTAEGLPGWAYHFASRGYTVAVPDWPGHGRSGALDLSILTGERVCQALCSLLSHLDRPVILLSHGMSSAFGWRLTELCGDNILAHVAIAPAPPGNIHPEPEVLCDNEDGLLIRTPFRISNFPKENAFLATPEFAATHFVGGSRHFSKEGLVSYTALLTHTGLRLLHERLNVYGSQLRVQDTTCFIGKPVMVVTGGEDLDHPRHVDKAIADWIAEQGASVNFAWLPDYGITGNGHMLMMERNSDQIADVILDWLDARFGWQTHDLPSEAAWLSMMATHK
ncbi:alpha/beta fold hydrolase [Granulicella sp. dw_53]|uniref:alpha/beta fold hydrolase n=1 Tax=Granulicella sp. dw_53 TaxID=2719792 RepID=UPI001BD2F2B2|nr:alpha/beta fold hydrolase [Granulicella sp. dw_53]